MISEVEVIVNGTQIAQATQAVQETKPKMKFKVNFQKIILVLLAAMLIVNILLASDMYKVQKDLGLLHNRVATLENMQDDEIKRNNIRDSQVAEVDRVLKSNSRVLLGVVKYLGLK